MKNFYSLLLTSVSLLILLTGCPGNDDDEDQKLELSKYDCELTNDDPYTIISVSNGIGEYNIKSSDEKVAIASVEEGKLYIFAVGMGETNITITDGNKKQAVVKVTINEYISTVVPVHETTFIKKGTTKELLLPMQIGSENYIISTDESIATAKIAGDKITITGVKTGETTVYLTKMIWPQHAYAVKVVDLYDLIVNKKELQAQKGQETAFHIICGNGDYTITPSEEGIVSFEQIAYTPEISGMAANPKTVVVQPLKAGTVTLTLKDAENKTNVVKIQVI